MSTKTWLQNEWDAIRQTLVDADHKGSTPTLPDILDEQAGWLLEAIELAQFELERGWYIEAKITLAMALEEHKARLVAHSRPAPMDQLWQGEEDEPIMQDEERTP